MIKTRPGIHCGYYYIYIQHCFIVECVRCWLVNSLSSYVLLSRLRPPWKSKVEKKTQTKRFDKKQCIGSLDLLETVNIKCLHMMGIRSFVWNDLCCMPPMENSISKPLKINSCSTTHKNWYSFNNTNSNFKSTIITLV